MIHRMPDISIQAFNYHLPDSQIAFFPCEERDGSKLFVHNQGINQHHAFRELPELVPNDSMFVFNNTKVIP
ncbi:MAG: hypothetical protein RLZZ185_1488, partial [Bacteroidota bacterium]